ncbi:MAG: hypothetical protein FWE22_01660 [Firmicutes bacterium]|nr:hypothetical protein [Bacillota bacterium]
METKNEKLNVRKSNRLQQFDYSQEGAYFITICAKDKAHIFGEVKLNVGAGIDRPHNIKK